MKTDLQTNYLNDYRPPGHLVETIDLHVELAPERTRVRARLQVRVNPDLGEAPDRLYLHGRNLELLQVLLDGRELSRTAYSLDGEGLTIPGTPERFTLETLVEINPQANTALEGLYRASDIYCTQCEAQGFRKITFFPDRPDVMARYTTTLVGAADSNPVLLANGNLVDSGTLGDGRHFATFADPYPKPSYLFAMVAGRLTVIEDRFITMSGREIKLQIYVEERNRDKCDHAMLSLQNAMRWDEQTYGLEYDLDEYKIVAVDDFNMGAMENKGLNVFNSKYVLARPETATDADYQGIEGVIAHEYFHNWTGNRVTCRDWFQLSLKEGLTVFRDQEFSSDMGSRAVKRIEDVRLLRNIQFLEDAGPMAHPVRPDSYIEINNFYTATVYNKGAEVIRMYQALLGEEGFKKGLQLYLDRHDGQAVTTDDFLSAMADANDSDLNQIRTWYSQSGTPVLDVSADYDAAARQFRLQVAQSCPETPGQKEKRPFLVPLRVGLIGPDGEDLPLQLDGEDRRGETTRTLRITEARQSFTFVNVPTAPVPSLLRDFSAPVKTNYAYRRDELSFLFSHDSDPFNRWEAGQRLAADVILEMAAGLAGDRTTEVAASFTNAFRTALTDSGADPAFLALALTLPAEPELADAMAVAAPLAVHAARQGVRKALAKGLKGEFRAVMAQMHDRDLYSPDPVSIGRRSLKNLCLAYLALGDDAEIHQACFDQYVAADNMTDRLAALACLVHNRLPRHAEALDAFYHNFKDDPLVVDKWFSLQATAPGPGTLDHVRELMEHPDFTMRNPNRVRSLIGAFAHGNPACFHAADGAGYAFVAERVLELDPVNPQVAARMLAPLSRWKRYEQKHRELMCAQLERIRRSDKLSNDVGEIVAKSLQN